MTSQASEVLKCKCKCKGTTWIIDENNCCVRCDCYHKDYLKRLWENFGVSPDDVKKIKDYEPFDDVSRRARDKAVSYIKNFDSFKDTEDNGFSLLGQPGAGKTHIALAIGSALLNRESNPVKVVYMPYLEVMRELKASSMDSENYSKILDRYIKAELLIIDDLFKDKIKNGQLLKINGFNIGLNEADMKHIYPILNIRYSNKRPMIINSECTPEVLVSLDEALARRIIEPCKKNNMIIFEGKKYNYSLRGLTK